MNLSDSELEKETINLKLTLKVLNKEVKELANELYDDEKKLTDFKKYMWDNRREMDPTETKVMMSGNELEIMATERKAKHFRKLYKIRRSPYFGKIIFDNYEEKENIYIGLTYLEDESKENNIIYDWRSPICSMFYDYETGYAEYEAPGGIVRGFIEQKRQFTIENRKFKRIFDNELNINDELLQEVLASESNEKMKNIVNTIQQEQNAIIRNTKDKNIIVQGIAGSGKTSVALHRVAFLLYKLKDLRSKDILLFSPNSVFSEYISNVLPELGEDNTNETTFYDFLQSYITEYKEIESFTSFIERYYKYTERDIALVKFKQSDDIIKSLEEYASSYTKKVNFKDGFIMKELVMTKEELNDMFHNRYSHLSLFRRLEEMAEKLNERHFKGRRTSSINKWLKERLNVSIDFKTVYKEYYKSKEFNKYYKSDYSEYFMEVLNNETLNYEDACPFVYLKGLLHEFPYDYTIKETVVDEAQDYTKLQYIILKKLLRKSNFTILGDVNQTINPYYHYKSLKELTSIIGEGTNYLELKKTYRSSPEIIEHTNNILGLNHISAIRKQNNVPVIFRTEKNLKEELIKDINDLKRNCKSIAVITKTDDEAIDIYNLLRKDFDDITLIKGTTSKFSRTLVVIPSYVSKGLEYDGTIVYTNINNKYKKDEKYLYYVACTRSQHHLIIYNQK